MKSDEGRPERSSALALETIVEPLTDEATLSSSTESAPPGGWAGDRAGRYWLRRELGVGGMGRVYEGYDPELQRPVAVKLLHSSFDAEWLSREARALAKLSHPNVVAVYDVGTFRARVFVAMELVDGPTLRQWVAAEPRKLEDLLANPEANTRALLMACGLDFDPACLRFHEAKREVRTASAPQVRAPLRGETTVARSYGRNLDPLSSALVANGIAELQVEIYT